MMGDVPLPCLITEGYTSLTTEICTPKDRRGWKAQGPDGEELRDGYTQGRSEEDV